jgi:phospholipid N-methyltransferase
MLARKMAEGLTADTTVVELGAGTGTLTDGLLEVGVAEKNLFLVESNREFADILSRRFPQATVLAIDADSLVEALPAQTGRIDCAISGLPILWFPREKKKAILNAVFATLRPDGFMRQLTYFSRPPVPERLLREIRLDVRLDGRAPLNIPPAFVYRFFRAGA